MRPLNSRQRKTKDPCAVCRMHRERCICAQIPRLELATQILLVIHHRELKRTTNTGTLAVHALTNSRIVIRGRVGETSGLGLSSGDGYHPLLLYPSGDAVILTPEFVCAMPKPIRLIVPDGNWRQASKVNGRYPELAQVTRVTLPFAPPAEVGMRREPVVNGMSTLEAIAKALAFFEGAETGARLTELYRLKLRQTLIGRGSKCALDGLKAVGGSNQ